VTELPIRLQMCGYTCRSRAVTRVIPKIIIPDLCLPRPVCPPAVLHDLLKDSVIDCRNSVFYRRNVRICRVLNRTAILKRSSCGEIML